MNYWFFYDQSTGVMLTTRMLLPGAQVAANTPPGYLPIHGDFDPLSQRVDVAAVRPPAADDGWQPPVIDYQPPAPADDQWQTWAWDPVTKRWVASPTLDSVKRSARQRMAAAWNAARQAGVTIGGKTAPTDAESWTRYLSIKQMAADGGWIDVPIPLVDGTFELLTAAKAAALWAALKDMERTLLGRLRDRAQAIEAATTVAEANAVEW